MKQNMGTADRVIRAIIGLGLIGLAIWVASGIWVIVCWVLAGIMLLTALLGICPLYLLFKFSTKKK